jgi:hypothetical protein
MKQPTNLQFPITPTSLEVLCDLRPDLLKRVSSGEITLNRAARIMREEGPAKVETRPEPRYLPIYRYFERAAILSPSLYITSFSPGDDYLNKPKPKASVAVVIGWAVVITALVSLLSPGIACAVLYFIIAGACSRGSVGTFDTPWDQELPE